MNARATPPSSVQNRSVVARTAPAAGASHMPVRTMNTSNLRPANNVANRMDRGGQAAGRSMPQNNTAVANRQNQLSQNRPPSTAGASMSNNRGATGSFNGGRGNNSRTWEAQGNSTDRGRAPQSFGGEATRGPSTVAGTRAGSNPGTGMTRSDRPSWAGSGGNGGVSRSESSPYNGGNNIGNNAGNNGSKSPNSNGNRSYDPPSRSSTPSRSYSAPRASYPSSRSYSAPPSAPSRTYSAPSRSNSAPSHSAPARRSSGGSSGGGSPRGGGGGGSSHGGGSPHGGGSRH